MSRLRPPMQSAVYVCEVIVIAEEIEAFTVGVKGLGDIVKIEID